MLAERPANPTTLLMARKGKSMMMEYISPTERRRRNRLRADALIELGSLDRIIQQLEQEPEKIQEGLSIATNLLDQGKNAWIARTAFPKLGEALLTRQKHLGTLVNSNTYPGTIEHRRAYNWLKMRVLKAGDAVHGRNTKRNVLK